MALESAPTRRLGILVKRFPKLSETFVLGEILRLEQRGLPVSIFSLRRPSDAIAHDVGRGLSAEVSYAADLNPARAGQTALAHAALLARSPLRYIKTLTFALGRTEPGGLREFLAAGCLVRPMQDQRIAHLHVHFANEPAGVAELLNMLCGVPFSISAHAKDIYLSSAEVLRRKLDKARFTVTCTDAGRHHLCGALGGNDGNGRNGTPARVSLVYHGVDTSSFAPQRAEGDSPAATPGLPPLILSVGRLREKKGFDLLVESCRMLTEAGASFRCEIVGYGPERDRLQDQIERHGLGDRVSLSGALTRDEVIERYRQAALFVLPCRVTADGDRDGIPNVLLEAMAMGLPTVSTNVSGIPEVITDGVDGILVEPCDCDALTGAIAELIERPDLRRRLGAAARARVSSDFCAEQSIEPLYRRLREALGEQEPQPVGDLEKAPAHV